MINGINEIAVTKLDVLDNLEAIKICVAYKYKGKVYKNFPASLRIQEEGTPVYEEHPGWRSDTSQVKKFERLPMNAKRYLKRLTDILGVPITILSVGSHENQTLFS